MFKRAMVSNDGRLQQPLRAGDGLISNFIVKLFTAEVDATLTVADVAGGHIVQGTTLTSDVVYTLPTATLMDAETSMDIGDAYSFVVTNSQAASFDVVIAVGAGVTKQGTNNTLSVPPQSSRVFTLVKTADNAFDLY